MTVDNFGDHLGDDPQKPVESPVDDAVDTEAFTHVDVDKGHRNATSLSAVLSCP